MCKFLFALVSPVMIGRSLTHFFLSPSLPLRVRVRLFHHHHRCSRPDPQLDAECTERRPVANIVLAVRGSPGGGKLEFFGHLLDL